MQDLIINYFNKGTSSQTNIITNNINKIIKDLCLALGLQFLHDNNITHKDIKPNNICLQIVQKTPIIKYIDFGLSEDLDELEHSYMNVINSGTPCYMSIDFITLQEIKYNVFRDIRNNNRFKKLL